MRMFRFTTGAVSIGMISRKRSLTFTPIWLPLPGTSVRSCTPTCTLQMIGLASPPVWIRIFAFASITPSTSSTVRVRHASSADMSTSMWPDELSNERTLLAPTPTPLMTRYATANMTATPIAASIALPPSDLVRPCSMSEAATPRRMPPAANARNVSASAAAMITPAMASTRP
jgi:hypothetical protein